MENISIIKNIFKIHPLVYFFAMIAVFTASFLEFFIISFLIVIHEIGHCLLARLWKGKVKEIKIYPLGGISKFYIENNISPRKEFCILIAGPFFQCLAFLILLFLLPNRWDMIKTYHFKILFFNLLPIYPLDGGKLVFLCLQTFFSWKKSFQICIILGYFILLFLLFQQERKWNLGIMILLLFTLLRKEQRQGAYQYQKFLLERYLHSYHFPKTKMISQIDGFYRNKKHLIQEEGKYYWEREYLEKHLKKD